MTMEHYLKKDQPAIEFSFTPNTPHRLQRAVTISLFSWARDESKYGWWGGEIGSKLWKLRRTKLTNETLATAKEYAEVALSWIVSGGYASSLVVQTYRLNENGIAILIAITSTTNTYEIDIKWNVLA